MLKVYIYEFNNRYFQYLGKIDEHIYVLDIELSKKVKLSKQAFKSLYKLHDTILLRIY